MLDKGNKPQNQALLNSKWTISKPLHVKRFDKAINITFDTQKKRFYGNDGCNKIFGNIEILNDKNLQFGMIASTKMACEDMDTPLHYTSLLGQTKNYKIEKNTLILLDGSQNVLLEFAK